MSSWSEPRGTGRLTTAAAAAGSSAAAAVAAAGFALTGAGAPGWLPLVLWSLALLWWVGDLVVVRTPGPAATGRPRAADAAVFAAGRAATRLLLVTAAAVQAARTHPRDVPAVWWGVALLLLVAAAEPVLERVRSPRDAVHLPGLGRARASTVLGAVPGVGVAATALAGLLALAGAGGATWLALGLLHGAFALGCGLLGLLDLRGRRSRGAELRRALTDYAPELLVYTGRDDGGPHQVAMWLAALERTGRRFAVVTRGPQALEAVAPVTTAPVVARAAWRDLDDVVVPSARVALYVNAASTNTNFVGYRELVHVYLGHGESDKALSYHPSHAMFDRVFVAGQAAVERYARHGIDLPLDRFVVVGRPQLDGIATRRPRPDGELPVVLYAPTWAGYNARSSHSSLPVAADVVRGLLQQQVRVLFRPHPFSRTRPAERAWVAQVEQLLGQDAARTGRAHRFGAEVARSSFAESANASDALVADVSSVLVDFLASDKPMAVVAVGGAAGFAERHPVARAAALVQPDGSDAGPVVAAMLADDPQRRERAAVRDFTLGGLSPDQAMSAFAAAVAGCVELADKRRVDLEDHPDEPPAPQG